MHRKNPCPAWDSCGVEVFWEEQLNSYTNERLNNFADILRIEAFWHIGTIELHIFSWRQEFLVLESIQLHNYTIEQLNNFWRFSGTLVLRSSGILAANR